ncbi:hypothetical protein [Thalassococcus sp. S3]|uniref:hypothetical protein n=1 Tax=Thalassococcus sp. S3 TaxID=2017482 RepID=UPI001023FBA1|nr:hypothetical protein [Thalassococcus sp. S3]QBF29852.1 hypothetical protein CFI11_01285 [Thalassococcus sp. S3]
MSGMQLTKTHMSEGVWQGVLTTNSDEEPKVRVMHQDLPVDGVTLNREETSGTWTLCVPIPKHAVADGVQTFAVFNEVDDSKLAHFTLIAGDAVADDIRGEVELLRAELDMLKRAFRRHCLETQQ